MRKVKKLLSVILCLCMIMTTIGTIAPVSVSAAYVSFIRDGSDGAVLGFGANDSDTDKVPAMMSEIVSGFAGKAADDGVFRVFENPDEGNEDNGYYNGYISHYTGRNGEKYVQYCDFLLEASSRITWDIYVYTKKGTADKSNVKGGIEVRPTGITLGTDSTSSAVAAEGVTLPTSISVGEWHNFAVEFNGNGGRKMTIYLDGVAYECVLPCDTYGQYCIRPRFQNSLKSDTYFDNYGYVSGSDDTVLYDASSYVMAEPSVVGDIVTYEESKKQFVVDSNDFTAADLKAAIDSPYTKKVYRGEEELDDNATVFGGDSVILYNNQRSFRYYTVGIKNSSNFNYTVNEDGVSCTVTGFIKAVTGTKVKVEIPEKVGGYIVTAIGDDAFKANTSLGEIVFPDTVKSIGNNAFNGASNVTVKKWPDALETIGELAFQNAKGSGMTGNFTNTQLKEIKKSAFAYATGLGDLTFPNTLTTIGDAAFNYYNSKNVILPDSLTSMGSKVFVNGFVMKSIRFPRNVNFTTIKSNTFSTSYEGNEGKYYGDFSIYIPETITKVQDDLLKYFQDGSVVKIYGAAGSEAEAFAERINAKLANNEYTNGLKTYGAGTEESPYTDDDKDGLGELKKVEFVYYDFDTNKVIFDESDYNFGDSGFQEMVLAGKDCPDPAVVQYTTGVGGKAKDDSVAYFTTASGGAGLNFVDSGNLSAGTGYTEYQTRAPENETNYVGAHLYYFYTTKRINDESKSVEILKVTNKEIIFNGQAIKDGDVPVSVVPGRWYTFVIEIPNDGSKVAKLYVNGKEYTSELADVCYGQRILRSFVNAKSASARGTIWYDNYRKANSTVRVYNPEDDIPAELASTSEDIIIENGENAAVNGGKILLDAEKSFTAAQFKELVKAAGGNEKIARMRIYSDDTYESELADSDYVTNLSKVVVATRNYYSFDRVLTYYDVEPLNNTKWAIEVISEDAKTAKITGFNERTVTDEDDFSNLVLPGSVLGYTITEIGDKAFYQNEEIENVTLPDSVEIIGANAFCGKYVNDANNKNVAALGTIKSVKLPANLKKIGSGAFANHAGITEIEFPEGLVEIESSAFRWSGLTEVSLPDSVTTVGASAFTSYSLSGASYGKIKTVKLSANLKTIGATAFSCNPIEEINLPDGLETIGNQAFYWTSIQAASIPNSVKSIGWGAFRLTPLKVLKLSSSVTSYNNAEFSGANNNVNEIIIPASVTEIGVNVFRDQDKDASGNAIPGTDNTGKMKDITVYGVKGTYAEQWANKYGFAFKEISGDVVVATADIYGDGSKELKGTDFDLRYGYKDLTFKANLINIASENKELCVTFTLLDAEGQIITSVSKDLTVGAEKDKLITEADGIKVDVTELKSGYTAKAEIVNKADGTPVCAPIEYTFSDAKKEVHALLIANSFGNDSFGYINKIAEADGVVLKVQNMYIGSAPLTKHYRNMSQNLTAYQPVINGVYGTAASASVKDALESDKWDVVALQAATHGFSADYSFVDYATWQDDEEGTMTGTPNVTTAQMLGFIKDYVQTYAPNAKRVMHMSWGPCEEQSRVMYDNRFADEAEYPSARQAVYELQKEAYEYASSIYSSVDGQMVPTSIAIQYALGTLGYQEHSGELVKTSNGSVYEAVPGEISIFRDETCHLTSATHYGRVLAGLTWYEYLTGNDARENLYQHAEIPADVMAKLKEAAHYANQQVVKLDGTKPVIEATEALVNVSVIGGSANVFVNGEDKGIAPATASYAVGTALKYVATPADSDKEFLYWAEASPDGKLVIVSDEETFEITVGSNVTYTAIYADAQDAVYVTFKANNKILVSGNKDMVEIPANPYMTGYVFDAWYNTDGVRLETSEIILSELTANTMYVAGFKAEKTAYTVSVTGANEQGGEFVYNSKITLTPAGEDGKYFAYWMRDGKIVCYTSEYTFYVSGNTNVEAVYADKEAEKQIVLVMAEPVIVGDNLDKIGFYAERNVPDGYTIAETGIIMSQLANFDMNTSGVIKAKAKSTAPVGQFTVRKGNAKGQTWYAKAYLIYSDGEKSYTVYSNTVSKTVK